MGHELKAGGYCARFIPEKGMNFVSLSKDGVEAIDQSTLPLFEKRFAGLGAMIGPHFHHRKVLPSAPDPALFPHSTRSPEPFSHGIGRYAPWTVLSFDESQIVAALSGSDLWNGVALKDLEGQDFKMTYNATLKSEGLQIEMSVVSDSESIVGLHTYYTLAGGPGRVISHVEGEYNEKGEYKPIPAAWGYENFKLNYELNKDTDFGFLPHPDKMHGNISLETVSHKVRVQYWSDNEENCWQLWHPNGSSFVCIEPLSAKNPHRCRLSVSQIKILISIQ